MSSNDEHFFNHARQRFQWAITDIKTIYEANLKHHDEVDVKAGFDDKAEA
jgi:hypothetical protein